jgi:hypothetical protein
MIPKENVGELNWKGCVYYIALLLLILIISYAINNI